MKKKLFAILLSLTLAFSLCACGAEDARGEVTSTEKEEVKETKEETKEEAENKEAASTEEPKEEDAEEDSEAYAAGTNVNGEYTNKTLGFGCKLDETWTIATEEEIKANNDATIAALEGESKDNLQAAMESGATIMDFMATNTNSTDSLNVTVQDLSIKGALVDMEQYMDMCADMLTDPLSQLGIDNLQVEKIDYSFAGKDCKAINISGIMHIAADEENTVDVEIYEKLVMVKKGRYVASVTACSFFENKVDDYLSMFYAVE